MKFRVCCFTALFCAALLSACAVRDGAFPPPANPAQRSERARTNAYGYVVDDPSGRPLANILVRLEPWDHGCIRTGKKTALCPGYLPYHTTTASDGRFELRGVPNGDYLLVIGTDTPGDLVRPTVHDHVTFTGGTQRLRAPTLPTIPCDSANYVEWCQGVKPSPDVTAYPRPAVETNGNYRLTTINPTREKPCAVAFNAERTKYGLPLTVVDEWLTENAREILAYRDSTGTHVPQPAPCVTGDEAIGVAEMVAQKR